MISVMIPVYNTEKYIGRCIDSVLASTCQDFEIILVDDGSTDSSLDVCRGYGRKDGRIRLFSQKHRGVSQARNKGIEYSEGEWIVFVDSDDMISSDFLEMVGREEYQDCDLLIFDFSKLGKKPDKKERKKDLKSIEHVYYYDKMHVIQIIEKTLCAKKLTVDGNSSLLSPCAKAYRKSVIKEYGIRFPPDIVIGEDKLFNIAFYRAMKQCAYIRKTAYFVGWRRDSATHCFHREFIGNYYCFQRSLQRLLREYGIFTLLEAAYYENVLSAMTEVLVFGIFNPDSPRTYRQNCKLCRKVRENEIYSAAAKYSLNTGNCLRRGLLFFFNTGCWCMVDLICKASYFVIRRMRK